MSLKFTRRVLYKLKRSYGTPVDYYKISSHDVNPETGVKTTVEDVIHIRRAIVLRAREFRSFVYDLAFISANKDFTEGGFFDPEDRNIILDAKDLPKGFDPNTDDYLIVKNKRYDVSAIQTFEENSAFLITARKLRSGLLVRQEKSLSVLGLTQKVTSVTVDKLLRSTSSSLSITQTLTEVT